MGEGKGRPLQAPLIPEDTRRSPELNPSVILQYDPHSSPGGRPLRASPAYRDLSPPYSPPSTWGPFKDGGVGVGALEGEKGHCATWDGGKVFPNSWQDALRVWVGERAPGSCAWRGGGGTGCVRPSPRLASPDCGAGSEGHRGRIPHPHPPSSSRPHSRRRCREPAGGQKGRGREGRAVGRRRAGLGEVGPWGQIQTGGP